MKRNIITSLVFVFSVVRLLAQTTITGGLVSGTWTKANSPYFITAAIMVANGTSLKIEPGVTVKFQGSYKFLNLGQITAVGAANDSIVFTVFDTIAGWRGIRFEHTDASNDSSRFKYCRMEYGNVSGLTSIDAEGGAILLLGFPKVLISNCLIAHCKASASGAIRGAGGGGRICNNVFMYNSAPSIGAVSCEGAGASPVLVYNNRFVSNTSNGTSTSYGGALATWNDALIYGNTFVNNTSMASDYSGGAIYCGSGCSAKIYNNTFFSNRSPNGGGGAIFLYSGNPTLYNNLICNNAALNGGGLHCESDGTIYNNTIANNSATKAGAINFKGSSLSIRNTILWGNTSTGGSGSQVFLNDEGSDPNFYYCDIQGGQAAFGMNSNMFYLGTYTNNINVNPKFIHPSAGTSTTISNSGTNWSLDASSPCFDAGDPAGTYPAYDITMGPRIINNKIDMGAYENALTNGIPESSATLSAGIYPNPGTGKFSLIAHDAAPVKFEVFNFNGTRVFESITLPGRDNADIDISGLASGIYFIKTGRQEVYKVVLQK